MSAPYVYCILTNSLIKRNSVRAANNRPQAFLWSAFSYSSRCCSVLFRLSLILLIYLSLLLDCQLGPGLWSNTPVLLRKKWLFATPWSGSCSVRSRAILCLQPLCWVSYRRSGSCTRVQPRWKTQLCSAVDCLHALACALWVGISGMSALTVRGACELLAQLWRDLTVITSSLEKEYDLFI